MTNKKSNKLAKIIVALAAIVVTIILSLLLLKSCGKKQEMIDNNIAKDETKVQEVLEEPNVEEQVVEEISTIVEEEKKEESIDKTNLSYWVNFVNKDGTVLQRTSYKYGSTPEYKGETPTYLDGSYYYAFKGWDKTISEVTGTQIYTALYDIVGTVSRSNHTSEVTSTVTPNYLTFTANTAVSTIALNKQEQTTGILSANVQYRTCTNGSYTEWDTYTPGTTGNITLTNAGDSVQFKATTTNSSFSNYMDWSYYTFNMTGSIAASGDVTSLLNGVGGDVTLPEGCFMYLFSGCASLTTAPSLPSKIIDKGCYYAMFLQCSSLTTAPALSATTLAEECYYGMFQECSSLTTAPALPATSLAKKCYANMFYKCSSLTTAPALPATTLVEDCYKLMFNWCTSLIVSDTSGTGYEEEWIIPTSGTFTNETALNQYRMFYKCAGTRSSDHMPGETGQSYTYYTQNKPVSASSN